MAAPHVAGVAALVKEKNPSYSTAQIKNSILTGADFVSNLNGKVAGARRLNAYNAVMDNDSPDYYSLTVKNGTGSSYYPAEKKVSIKANTAPLGQTFDKWTGGNGGAFTNASGAETVFTMPANTATVTAAYKSLPAVKATQLTYSLATKTYNGKGQGLTITPKSGVGNVTAIYYTGTKGTSYARTTAKPIKVGSYAVTANIANGKNNSAVSNLELGTFKIDKANLAKIKLSVADMAWTGKQIKPTKFIYNGVSFAVKSNATVKKYGANKNIGKGTIQITGTGSFTGTKTITYNIVPKTNSVSRITAGKKQMTVTWSKVAAVQNVTGYQIRVRSKGATAWNTFGFKPSVSSVIVTGLVTGRQYEIQSRSFKTVSGAKYYSAWSAMKTSAVIK